MISAARSVRYAARSHAFTLPGNMYHACFQVYVHISKTLLTEEKLPRLKYTPGRMAHISRQDEHAEETRSFFRNTTCVEAPCVSSMRHLDGSTHNICSESDYSTQTTNTNSIRFSGKPRTNCSSLLLSTCFRVPIKGHHGASVQQSLPQISPQFP